MVALDCRGHVPDCGSDFWARPTPRERRLAALRADATARGFKVGIDRLDAWTHERLRQSQIPCYRTSLAAATPSFELWRFPDRVDWTPSPETRGMIGREGALAEVIQQLPPAVLGIRGGHFSLSLMVDEDVSGFSLDDLEASVQSIRAILDTLD